MTDIVTFFAALTFSAAQSSSAYIGPSTQPLSEGTAGIRGRVLDALSTQPVAGLEVLVFEVDGAGGPVLGPLPRAALTHTDADGRFSVINIGAGSYKIRVNGKTHLPACLGSSREPSEPCDRIQLNPNQIQRDIVISARPAGIVRGRILDDNGRPAAGASVSAMCMGTESCLTEDAKSDSQGRFEIGGIPPGDVALSADFPVGKGSVERAYYPGVWEIDAALPIAVSSGQPVTVDFRLPKVVIGAITARVFGPPGFRLDRFELSQSDRAMQALEGPAARVENLRAGRYLVGSLGNTQYAGFKSVDVSDGDVDLPVTLEEAGVINGRIITEQGGVPPLENWNISAWWWLDDDVVGAVLVEVAKDGHFTFGNIFGDRTFRLFPAKGWRVVSIRANGQDVTDNLLHVASGARIQMTITVGRQ